MNQILTLFLTLIFLTASAATGGASGYTYTNSPVTDCAQTSAQYDRFYSSGELGIVIPGLAEGLVPQGISYIPEDDELLFCGYRSDKGNSALIAVDRGTGEIRKQVSLSYADGSSYNGHAGGVCVTESDIYISNASHLYRISLTAFRALPAVGYCSFEEEIPVPVNASFCCYTEGVLWVGEFQYAGDYPTDPSHSVRSTDGMQRAWICGYSMSGRTGFESPDYILSVTERIQGITTRNGIIYLSQSYGRRASSSLLKYEAVMEHESDMTIQLNQQEVPLWILDSTSRTGAMLCPPMTECLCTVEDTVYVLFESASEPYMNPSNPSVNPIDRVFLMSDF